MGKGVVAPLAAGATAPTQENHPMREYTVTLNWNDGTDTEFSRFAYCAESAVKSCELEWKRHKAERSDVVPVLTSVVVTWSL
jgi:hypothetical protein